MPRLPLYIRATIILFFFILLFAALYFARRFLIPLSLAALLSLLFYPLAWRMEVKLKMNRLLVNFLIILIVVLSLSGLVYLVSSQIFNFVADIPKLQSQIDKRFADLQTFIENKTTISSFKQIEWINRQFSDWLETSGTFIQNTVLSTTSIIANIGIIQFYIFFFLHYRQKFKKFIFRITPEATHPKVDTIIQETKTLIQSYITGVFIVVVIMAVSVTTGLLALGIPFAFFLGILSALLNIIPYIGIFISAILAVVITFLTKDSALFVFAVICLYLLIHALESNIFTPNIVGSKVSVNPLVTFIALIVGSELWGVMGMILFIPFTGILKVICDNIPALRPYGYLMGTEGTKEYNFNIYIVWRKITRIIWKRK